MLNLPSINISGEPSWIDFKMFFERRKPLSVKYETHASLFSASDVYRLLAVNGHNIFRDEPIFKVLLNPRTKVLQFTNPLSRIPAFI